MYNFDHDKPAIVHVHNSTEMHYASAARNVMSVCHRDVVGMTMLPHHYFGRTTDEYEWCPRCLAWLVRQEEPKDPVQHKNYKRRLNYAKHKETAAVN